MDKTLLQVVQDADEALRVLQGQVISSIKEDIFSEGNAKKFQQLYNEASALRVQMALLIPAARIAKV